MPGNALEGVLAPPIWCANCVTRNLKNSQRKIERCLREFRTFCDGPANCMKAGDVLAVFAFAEACTYICTLGSRWETPRKSSVEK